MKVDLLLLFLDNLDEISALYFTRSKKLAIIVTMISANESVVFFIRVRHDRSKSSAKLIAY